MKIKAILLVILALCMVSFTTLPIFAAEATGSNSTSIQVSTEYITYPDFSFNVPPTIPIGEIQRTAVSSIKSVEFTVSISGSENLEGRFVEVVVKAPDDEFALHHGVYSLPYSLYNTASGGTPLKSGDLFAAFFGDDVRKGRIEVDEMNIPATGTYSGVIQFEVTVRDLNAST